MIIIPDIQDNPVLRETGADFKIGFGETAKAGAIETLIRSGVSSLGRSFELDLAERADRSKPKMTSEEFTKSEFFRPGLKFPNGVGENVARITADRKDDENLRNFTIQQGASQLSFFGKAGLFGTNLMAAMLDPINIGSAFIPIVGQARFASMVSKVGFTGARAGKGLVEGAFGAAVVEPFILGAAIQEQADYDSMDSLLNVAFGSIFGAALHVGLGTIGDAIRGHTPDLIETYSRTAVAQAMDGRVVDVTPLSKVTEDLEIDPDTGIEIPSRVNVLEPIREVLSREGLQPTNQTVLSRIQEVLDTPVDRLTAIDKEVLQAIENSPEIKKLSEILQKEVPTAEDAQFARSFKDRNEKVNVDAEKSKLSELDKKIAQAKEGKPRTDKSKAAKQRKISKLEKEKAEIEQQIIDKQGDTPELKSGFTEEEIIADVERTFKPEADSTYNKQDVDIIDEVIARNKEYNLEQELKDNEAKIARLREQGILNDADLAEYDEAVQILKDTTKMASIIDKIAVCAARG